MPTFKEFVETLESRYGVEVKRLDGEVKKITAKGVEVHTPYQLIRQHGGKTLYATVPQYLTNDYVLSPDLLAYFCRRLGIDPEEFGLNLH